MRLSMKNVSIYVIHGFFLLGFFLFTDLPVSRRKSAGLSSKVQVDGAWDGAHSALKDAPKDAVVVGSATAAICSISLLLGAIHGPSTALGTYEIPIIGSCNQWMDRHIHKFHKRVIEFAILSWIHRDSLVLYWAAWPARSPDFAIPINVMRSRIMRRALLK